MKNKLFATQIGKAKQDMRNRYLAGETVHSISTSYGISDRAIYYHLGDISPDEKALHTKNADLRRMANKKHRKEEQKHEQENSTSPTETIGSSLSDFDAE